MNDKLCPFLVHFERPDLIRDLPAIKTALKYGDAAGKASALKQAILIIISGDTYFRDLPAIIVRNVLPCADEDLKLRKLILLYLETVYKGHDDVYGRVPPDTGLVRDYLRRNLEHRDEYVRGLTLRFVSRLAVQHEPHDDLLLDPLLVESVVFNLYHRHRFVRRHAYSAIFAIYYYIRPSLPHGVCQLLLPDDDDDALDRVVDELSSERDAAALRDAFLMLCTCARERAVAYVLANANRVVTEWPDIVQVVAITLIRRACWGRDNKDDQGKKLIGILISLSARSDSSSVIYAAADALLSLCSDDEPVALCAATNAYLKLLFSPLIDDDTDVKRIVLDRLQQLGRKLSTFLSSRQLTACSSPNPNMIIEESNQQYDNQ